MFQTSPFPFPLKSTCKPEGATATKIPAVLKFLVLDQRRIIRLPLLSGISWVAFRNNERYPRGNDELSLFYFFSPCLFLFCNLWIGDVCCLSCICQLVGERAAKNGLWFLSLILEGGRTVGKLIPFLIGNPTFLLWVHYFIKGLEPSCEGSCKNVGLETFKALCFLPMQQNIALILTGEC